jgi:hypothetical protein
LRRPCGILNARSGYYIVPKSNATNHGLSFPSQIASGDNPIARMLRENIEPIATVIKSPPAMWIVLQGL